MLSASSRNSEAFITMRSQSKLILSDGEEFVGEAIGAPVSTSGELVFTTGMVGYSEALTDPSYFGQILVFTYPLIGNYGIPKRPTGGDWSFPRGFESALVHASAAIVATDTPEVFHWNSFQSLDRWLREAGVPGIVNLDTRHLVHKIRQIPYLGGRVEPQEAAMHRVPGQLTESEGFFRPEANDILPFVSQKEVVTLGKGSKRIAVVDCGVKWNILRQLVERGVEVQLVPWNTDLSTVDCSGWLLSNGPGNPERTGGLVERVKPLLHQDRPILGICLGNQILAMAAGAKPKRMAFGHRSHNQPVYKVGTRQGYITSQNHGYEIDEGTLAAPWEVWFRNVNDDSLEGIRHMEKPFRSVQFHPESAGGPRDTSWILQEFVDEVLK